MSKVRIPKTLRRVIISVVVLIVVSIIGGSAYALVMDQLSNSSGKIQTTPSTDIQSPPVIKPTLPGANVAEGVSIESVNSPVKAGTGASVIASTNAGSSCVIAVAYSGAQEDSDLTTPKNADDYGSVSWTWTVAASAPIGTWPIKITCTYHNRTAVVDSSLQITH